MLKMDNRILRQIANGRIFIYHASNNRLIQWWIHHRYYYRVICVILFSLVSFLPVISFLIYTL